MKLLNFKISPQCNGQAKHVRIQELVVVGPHEENGTAIKSNFVSALSETLKAYLYVEAPQCLSEF